MSGKADTGRRSSAVMRSESTGELFPGNQPEPTQYAAAGSKGLSSF